MTNLTKTEIYPIPIEKFYQVITDYESYPEYMDGVDSTRIIQQTEQSALVEYSLNIIKRLTYRLQLAHAPPQRVSWVLDSGDLFKKNEGAWELQDLGDGRTQVTYTLDVEFKFMIPKIIVNKVIKHSLPALFANVSARAKNL